MSCAFRAPGGEKLCQQRAMAMRTTPAWLLLLLRPTAAMTLPRRAALGLTTTTATAHLRSGAPALASAAPTAGARDVYLAVTALLLSRHCSYTPLLHCSYNTNTTGACLHQRCGTLLASSTTGARDDLLEALRQKLSAPTLPPLSASEGERLDALDSIVSELILLNPTPKPGSTLG